MPNATVTNVKPRAQELLKQVGPPMYREAYNQGVRLSALLDAELEVDPEKDALDGFGQLMKCAGIKMVSNFQRGVYADDFKKWDDHPTARNLIPEWLSRQWRKVSHPETRALAPAIGSTEYVPGSVARPYVDYPGMIARQVTPAIPLDELVSMTIAITGDQFRAMYLTDDATSQRMVRVEEFAEFPRARITTGQNQVQLFKYGRALEISYEAMRRMKIDLLALYIERLAINAENDKVATVIDVMLNGDGNANTSAIGYTLTALDSAAVVNNLTLKGWLAYRLKFLPPYRLSTVIVQEATALQMMLLNSGTNNIPLVMAFPGMFGSLNPTRDLLSGAVRMGWTPAAPSLKILGFDNSRALIRLSEVGSDISEVERFVMRQAEALTLSEVEGYMVFDQQATRLLDLTA